MATLYVEDVPDDIYEAVRRYAREHRSSIAAEVVALLRQNFPTEKELKARRDFLRKLRKIHASPIPRNRSFPSTEEMLREDRDR